MVIGMDDTLTQIMFLVFIADYLAAVHQYFDACNKILGVLSRPGYNILKFF